ncbi:MAG: heparinase II/III-family protein, partial [Bdellovibrionales bacterium]|nr:heparinase II/III-family protein [Bdellovibrionales bacterium]
RELSAAIAPLVKRSLKFLESMCDEAGEPYLLNDSAVEETVTLPSLKTYARAVGIAESRTAPASTAAVEMFSDTGYGVVTNGPYKLVVDAAPLGPSHNPGHGHADFLTFLLYIDGAPVVVDAGNADYVQGQLRAYFRSTRAHSTIEIDDTNSAEVWSAFRVGRRTTPTVLDVRDLGEQIGTVVASHAGYRHLSGKPVVARRWICSPVAVVVVDLITSSANVLARGRFHLHPMWDMGEASMQCTGEASAATSMAFTDRYGQGSFSVHTRYPIAFEAGHLFSPAFGRPSPAPVLGYQPAADVSHPEQLRQTAVFVKGSNARVTWQSDFAVVVNGTPIDWSSAVVSIGGAVL